jgi:hypothetical protein
MSIIGSNILAGASGQAGGGGAYQISRSVRLNAPDSAYLSRTPASSGNRKTFTFSCWAKLTNFGSDQTIFAGWDGTASNQFEIRLQSDSTFFLNTGGGVGNRTIATTTAVFRDPSAWYHLVCAVDTTQASAANHFKFYVNNTLQALSLTASGPQNLTTQVNGTFLHHVGVARALARYFSGLLADIHFIDGQALDPSSFGEFDANGVWQPIDASGLTYGTNGFHLPFSDNSTAAALGTDTSGNGNTWTVNNISVTAGAGNDSLVDSPTNYGTDTGAGGTVRGNYCTWNPLINGDTAANGNLDVTNDTARGTQKLLEYDAYWEITSTGGTTTAGIVSDGGTTNTTTVANGKTYGFKLSAAGSLEYINITDGGSFTSITTGLTGIQFPYASAASATTGSLNAGQRPFAATAPSGFKALCTTNLPEGTITTSGTFTGNANANGPFVWLNGVPTAMTINGNAVTFATHADKLSNGFKVRTSSGSYNTAGSNTYSISTTGAKFKYARAQSNP